MIKPRQYHDLRIKKFLLTISPDYQLRWIRDLLENNVGILELSQPASQLSIKMECYVEISNENPFNFILAPDSSEFPFEYEPEIGLELFGLTLPTYPRDLQLIQDWLSPIWRPGKRYDTLGLLQTVNKAIYSEIQYQRREIRGVQTPGETLERKKGACRDFATFFMEVCRFLGLASRFVSGYMYSEDIVGQMSMHGWAEVYLPGAGWLGFDPSWGILSTAFYIPVAVSRHPEHIPPISGTYFGFSSNYICTDVDLFVEKVSQGTDQTDLDVSKIKK